MARFAHYRRPDAWAVLSRDLLLLAIYGVRRALGERRVVRFVPEYPNDRMYICWRVLRYLGVRMTTDPQVPATCSVAWSDATVVVGSAGATVNAMCTDISKTRVGRSHAEAFGYSLQVDPAVHVGSAVEKSDGNAAHDGRVVECPRPAAAGMVYQRVVDNQVDDDLVEDLRVVVVGHEIAVTYRKLRPVVSRFSNTNRLVELSSASASFSPVEIEALLSMAGAMGLDFGEMDVLRDRSDGRIYVVDVNKTCWGPPNHLPYRESWQAVRAIAGAFERTYLGPRATR